MSGRLRINKVIGNINFTPGRSFRSSADLVPYLRDDGNSHDFSHIIHRMAFEGAILAIFHSLIFRTYASVPQVMTIMIIER
jgi:hypothetical protein